MQAKHPIIGEVRGMGLLVGVELVEDRETKAPAAAAVNALMEATRENRLMIGKGGTYGNVIRISPPLNISKSDVDEFALRFEASLQRVATTHMAIEEKAFYRESPTTKPATLNCPFCRTADTYELRWMVRKKVDQVPRGADERDRARFAKFLSYMVLMDDKAMCKNMRCRKRFDISGIKTMAFI